jgi:hypothetical protein
LVKLLVAVLLLKLLLLVLMPQITLSLSVLVELVGALAVVLRFSPQLLLMGVVEVEANLIMV